MSSNTNFRYKGIPLNQIYANDGTNTNISGYNGIPNTTNPNSVYNFSNYTGMRPTPLGYAINGTDLSNQVTAKTELYTNSTTVAKPPNTKTLRVISVGGAGGNGAHGGKATATAYDGDKFEAAGGAGGLGGHGYYAYETIDISNVSNINITVGSGGNGGYTPAGSDNSCKSNYNSGNAKYTDPNTDGTPGNGGNAGNASFITLDNSNIQYANAAGGNGGGGGKGGFGSANATTANGQSGAFGSNGTSKSKEYKGGTVYPQLIYDGILTQSAVIGAAPAQRTIYGDRSNTYNLDGFLASQVAAYLGTNDYITGDNATGGSDGAVRLIWLYD